MADGVWDEHACSSSLGEAGHVVELSDGLSAPDASLDHGEAAAGVTGAMPSVAARSSDQRLVERRLGNAAGLFVALRCKDSATATHGLHVALLCSAWARKMAIAAQERDEIEVASLLHDVGVIGVPDQILHKPSQLESRERGIVAHARRLGQEILRASGAGDSLLAIVKNIPVWYNAPTEEGGMAGHETPLGSRMIAIAEAFDSMTTDHIFRPARSREQALDEVYRFAGTQFDPLLVDQFSDICRQDLSQLYRQLASEWLQELERREGRMLGGFGNAAPPEYRSHVMTCFQAMILDNMRDCVVMVDPALNVIGWNRRAEELTGIVAESIGGRAWQPELVQMRDDQGRLVLADRCPLRQAIATGMKSAARFGIARRDEGPIIVDAQIMPVLDQDCSVLGAAMVMQDVSSERTLEKLCENLYNKATLDPLTQVPNRAEFERVHADLVQKYRKSGSVFSVIICDLDHFKQVNDTYGHQAGDEVLLRTVTVLQEHARAGDLVARYGGEEFVIVCPDCGIAAATRRAEQMRDAISQTEHRLLAGRRVTASFGVTQVQAGDTAETILRRADRGLYQAKNEGRNSVIQLGTATCEEKPVRRWAFWRRRKRTSPEVLLEEDMVTPGPLRFVLEKLRGFVADHQAAIKRTEENILEFELIALVNNARRKTDLRNTFRLVMQFSEEPASNESSAKTLSNEISQIRIHVLVALEKAPGGPDGGLTDHARQLVTSLRAYLMARRAGNTRQDQEGKQGKKLVLPTWTTQLP